MNSGTQGTFVVPWHQSEVDGQRGGPIEALGVGSVWSWSGDPTRVDGPSAVLPLGAPEGAGKLRRRAARTVRRMLQVDLPPAVDGSAEDDVLDAGFEVTDARHLWHVTLIDSGVTGRPLCVFSGALPPRGRDLWVVKHNLSELAAPLQHPEALLCFAGGTLIDTEEGTLPVEQVTPDMRLQTRDDGLQPVLWAGVQRVSSARLRVMPELAPHVVEAPEGRLAVSPDHRILLAGRDARALFNCPEVLVAARDLDGGGRVRRDRSGRSVTYHHLLLERHQIVFAGGLEAESFHPADGAGTKVPGNLLADPSDYGPHARRCLTSAEAALLSHEAA